MDRAPIESPRAAEARADLAIVADVLQGKPGARDRLVERLAHLPALLRRRHRRLGSPLDTAQLEDVVQNALLAIWEKLAAFDGRAPLPGWALGFATLELFKAMARTCRRREQTGGVPEIEDPRPAADPATTERLALLLDRLPALDVEILRQKHIEGRTFAEIAALVGAPTASVKTRYYRAVEALRRRQPREGGESP